MLNNKDEQFSLLELALHQIFDNPLFQQVMGLV